jgi:hypothetical protein
LRGKFDQKLFKIQVALQKKLRKRQRSENNWQQNLSKFERQAVEEYVSTATKHIVKFKHIISGVCTVHPQFAKTLAMKLTTKIDCSPNKVFGR